MIYITYCAFTFVDHLNICIVALLLHMYDINRLPWVWPRRAETCRRSTACLYVIVSNYCTVVGIYVYVYIYIYIYIYICVCVCVCVCVYLVSFSLIIKSTRCTNFSNLFLKWESTCFGQFLCPSSGVFHCTHMNGICNTGLLTACEQDQDVPSWSCSPAVSKPVCHIALLYVQWKIPDDGQRNCPKHADFHFKNKFEKLVHLVCFHYKKFKMMHGRMNVEIWWLVSLHERCIIILNFLLKLEGNLTQWGRGHLNCLNARSRGY